MYVFPLLDRVHAVAYLMLSVLGYKTLPYSSWFIVIGNVRSSVASTLEGIQTQKVTVSMNGAFMSNLGCL